MKFTKYLVPGFVAVSAMLATSSCVGDLNVEPDDPNTITEISSKADMEGVFASMYYDLLTGDGLNVSDGGAGSYLRCHFNLQEIVADEFFISDKWNDPGYTVLNFNTWGNDNEWIYAAYSRENHLAKVASVFIHDTSMVPSGTATPKSQPWTPRPACSAALPTGVSSTFSARVPGSPKILKPVLRPRPAIA